LNASRSFTHPAISPSQAIIRPLPIIRLSSPNKNKNLSNSTESIQSNDPNSYCIMSSSSTEEFDVINKPDHIIQQESSNEKFSIHDKSPYEYPHVLYIDEDDERSVSLKSSISDSKTPSYTISIKINRLQTLSISSSLSSSSNVSNDFYTNQRKFHESSV
jgi:hypothetical protein